jgi:hypothetical protein
MMDMNEKRLELEDLLELVDAGVFERGTKYFQRGAVRNMRRAGSRVEAEVHGGRVYHTWIRLKPPFRTACTCPYDNGVCKHVVAVGLQWIETQSQASREQPPVSLGEQLRQLQVDELRELLVELADNLPDAGAMIERMLWRHRLQDVDGVSDAQRLAEIDAFLDPRLDPERLQELMETAALEWHDEASDALHELSEIEDDLVDLVRELSDLPPNSAVPALELVCDRLASATHGVPDAAGYWQEPARKAADALAELLVDADTALHLKVQARLLPAFEGGAHFLEPVILTASLDPTAGETLARRLGPRGGRSLITALNLLLRAGAVERAEELIVEWGVRDGEALMVMAEHFRSEALRVKGEAGTSAQVERLLAKAMAFYRQAADAPSNRSRSKALEQLAGLAAEHGSFEEALQARIRLFRFLPSLESWQQVMAAAEAAGRRRAVKEELQAWLENEYKNAWLVCRIMVSEAPYSPEDLAYAARLARIEDSCELRLEVARAAVELKDEAIHGTALGLLEEAAEKWALQGGDHAYRQAAIAAGLIKKHFPQHWADWQRAYIGRHSRRRNLMQALVAAGLR